MRARGGERGSRGGRLDLTVTDLRNDLALGGLGCLGDGNDGEAARIGGGAAGGDGATGRNGAGDGLWNWRRQNGGRSREERERVLHLHGGISVFANEQRVWIVNDKEKDRYGGLTGQMWLKERLRVGKFRKRRMRRLYIMAVLECMRPVGIDGRWADLGTTSPGRRRLVERAAGEMAHQPTSPRWAVDVQPTSGRKVEQLRPRQTAPTCRDWRAHTSVPCLGAIGG